MWSERMLCPSIGLIRQSCGDIHLQAEGLERLTIQALLWGSPRLTASVVRLLSVAQARRLWKIVILLIG